MGFSQKSVFSDSCAIEYYPYQLKIFCFSAPLLESDQRNSLKLPSLKLGPNHMMRVMISVIDLDPKPVHRLPTWVERRREWLNSYLHQSL